MPDCSQTKEVCGKACTIDGQKRAYYKDCKTGRIGYGESYTEAIQSATKNRPKCANLTGASLEACKNGIKPTVRRIDPIKFINAQGKPVKKINAEIKAGGKPGASGIGRGSIPLGSRFDTKENNWIDTEKLLGDTSPDDDPSTVNRPGDGGSGCFGIPIPCPFLAIGVGAVIVLLVALR